MKTFNFFADAGHGWLAVRVEDIEAIGLTAQEFSPYSYRSGDTLYLEEDCDAGVFIQKWEAVIGNFDSAFVDHGNYSPIRDLDRLPPDTLGNIWL